MDKFKKCYVLVFRREHCEALGEDDKAIGDTMPHIMKIVATLAHEYVMNGEKFGMFYRQPPSGTLSNALAAGHKKEKKRMNFLSCCNSEGSEKV